MVFEHGQGQGALAKQCQDTGMGAEVSGAYVSLL